MNEEKTVEQITLTYDDGTSRTIDKGFLCEMAPGADGETVTVTFDMVQMSGQDLRLLFSSVFELYVRLGFGRGQGAADEED